jgi:hypothetical protein
LKRAAYIIVFILLFQFAFTQNHTQTIRGKVIDKETQTPLVGASVVVINSNPFKGAATDIDGKFRIEGVSVGRQSLKISFIGYEDLLLSNLEIISGKEQVISAELSEKIITSKEVVISAQKDKDQTVNEMSIVSARTFSVEETNRYAGAWGDPSRMASNFAGVSIVSDKRNDIVVRGNSPIGVLWRLDGIAIPNPNHFAVAGSSGGAISMINSNLLANSDFATGAFTSEYGNASSAVFDLKLRNGNNEKHEFLAQVGVNGFEAGAEGPFSKKKNSSYLFDYRYSTVAVLDKIGISIVDETPVFQDLSFKLNFPFKKGVFDIFAVAGISKAQFKPEKDSTTWARRNDQRGYSSGSSTAIIAMSYMRFLSNSTYMKMILTSSVFNPNNSEDSTGYDYNNYELNNQSTLENRNVYSVMFNTKISSRHILRYGAIVNNIIFQNRVYFFTYNTEKEQHNINTLDGNTFYAQLYADYKFNITENLTMNTGAHFIYFFLNDKACIEPRFAFRWGFASTQSLSFGFGLHDILQPMPIYFAEIYDNQNNITTPNKSLGFTKSYHYVLSYDWLIRENLRTKVELYYQDIYNAPISNDNPTLCLLNFGTSDNIFTTSAYSNTGRGRNFGGELTLEKFFSRKYYFLFTASIFNSKYFDGNDVERNTRYNCGHAFNLLAGKEFVIGKKKNSTIGLDIGIINVGGQYYIPIDLDKSIAANRTVYIDSLAYTERFKDFFKIDVKITYRINQKRCSHHIGLELNNIFDTRNIEDIYYNANRQELAYNYQLGRIPVFFYKIEF